MPDTTLSTLEKIRIKIRRLAKSPSASQITDAQIDDYVNTFVLYDFPRHLMLGTLTKFLTFYTDPYIGSYSTVNAPVDDPLYNFKNEYVNVSGPVYINGRRCDLSFSPEEFYNSFPQSQSEFDIGTGNGLTFNYSGTLSEAPIVRGNVLISAIDNFNDGLEAHDDGNGSFDGDVVPGGTIDYVTGDYSVTFNIAVKDGVTIYAYTTPYDAAMPISVLYFNNEFVLRPIPDRPYKIDIQCNARPTEMIAAAQVPELSELWEYIAYGAAKKVFEDRMDTDSLQNIMLEFKNQEKLANRRVIFENSSKRASTIYSSGMPIGTYDGFNN